MPVASRHGMARVSAAWLPSPVLNTGDALVGKILDKRYVVLEQVGPDGAGVRFLVYDMNSMSRAQLRVDPE